MKILFAEPDNKSVILGCPWWKERANHLRLSSDFYTCCVVHAEAHPHFFKPLTKACLTLRCGKLRRGDAVFHSKPHMDV